MQSNGEYVYTVHYQVIFFILIKKSFDFEKEKSYESIIVTIGPIFRDGVNDTMKISVIAGLHHGSAPLLRKILNLLR